MSCLRSCWALRLVKWREIALGTSESCVPPTMPLFWAMYPTQTRKHCIRSTHLRCFVALATQGSVYLEQFFPASTRSYNSPFWRAQADPPVYEVTSAPSRGKKMVAAAEKAELAFPRNVAIPATRSQKATMSHSNLVFVIFHSPLISEGFIYLFIFGALAEQIKCSVVKWGIKRERGKGEQTYLHIFVLSPCSKIRWRIRTA